MRATFASFRTLRAVLAFGLLLAAAACDSALDSAGTQYPPAVVYELEPQFVGVWVGDIDTVSGTLEVERLEDGYYRASFVSDDQETEYVLLAEHTKIEGQVSNRCVFRWQDGRGSRGQGWLLINREDTALTGTFGFGSAVSGLGDWTFVRLE